MNISPAPFDAVASQPNQRIRRRAAPAGDDQVAYGTFLAWESADELVGCDEHVRGRAKVCGCTEQDILWLDAGHQRVRRLNCRNTGPAAPGGSRRLDRVEPSVRDRWIFIARRNDWQERGVWPAVRRPTRHLRPRAPIRCRPTCWPCRRRPFEQMHVASTWRVPIFAAGRAEPRAEALRRPSSAASSSTCRRRARESARRVDRAPRSHRPWRTVPDSSPGGRCRRGKKLAAVIKLDQILERVRVTARTSVLSAFYAMLGSFSRNRGGAEH